MEGQMSPLKIEILLWYWYSPKDYPNQDAPAVSKAICEFYEAGILTDSLKDDTNYAGVKEALEPYINALLAVPLPKQIWICENKNTNK